MKENLRLIIRGLYYRIPLEIREIIERPNKIYCFGLLSKMSGEKIKKRIKELEEELKRIDKLK